MEVCLPCKRLRTSHTHRVKRDVYQPDVHTFDVRLAEPRGAEMTRQELQQTEMWRNEVVDMLLTFRKCFFVGSSKFLLAVEGVCMSVNMLAYTSMSQE